MTTNTQESPNDTGHSDEATGDLLRLLVKSLVDQPNAVDIGILTAEQSTIFEVKVDAEDVRRMIGRQGRTADALRQILLNLGSKAGRRYHLEILEPTNRITVPLGC